MRKKVILVGAGNRCMIYAKYAKKFPERMQVVGVVDPSESRIIRAKREFNLSDNQCFRSVEEAASLDRFADAIINGTMDNLHVITSIPFLEKGYDMLLEKPFVTNKKEMQELMSVAKKYKNKIMICHVLRYTKLYSKIKELLLNNEIGDVYNIQTTEHVSFHHMAVSYVRGKWRNKDECHASMLLAKSCHDIDLITWLNNKTRPCTISSFGGDFLFNKNKKPQGAGSRCMVDCEIEDTCIYSAKKHYLYHPNRWAQYVWTEFENKDDVKIEDKEKSIREYNPFGKCVWDYNKNIVDQQVVNIQFENGSIASHNMVGGTPKSQRRIHILGSLGEIIGMFEDNNIIIRRINPTKESDYDEEIINFEASGDMVGAFGDHGGGDAALIADFISYISDEETSISRTTIDDSVASHMVVFAADEAMEKGRIIKYNDFIKEI